ncbi:gamma-glutamylcyclotransferase [Opitutales bacterium]|nr:gamma-glutamylcyclotransferase [Opitutales bacterium]
MQCLYFAYGSNMNFKQMETRCPGAVYVSQARLDHWSYFINTNGYAGIEEKTNSYTLGCVWELGENHLQSLDRYEAVNEGYYDRARIQVMLVPSRIEKETVVYLSNNRKYGKPAPNYQNEVIEGAGHVGLPEDYIQKLLKWS